MIEIFFCYNKDSELIRFYAQGHSKYQIRSFKYKFLKLLGKKPESSDIVCSAVSALLYTLVLGLNKVLKAKVKLDIKESGWLNCVIKSSDKRKKEQIKIIVDTIKAGLEEIKEQYSGEIEIQEVII